MVVRDSFVCPPIFYHTLLYAIRAVPKLDPVASRALLPAVALLCSPVYDRRLRLL